MRFEKESDAFYDALEQSLLPSSAIALWYALLHFNKKTGWKDEFLVANPSLQLKAGLTDSSFKRARATLVERGFIERRTRGNSSPAYRMKRLADEEVSEFDREEGWIKEINREI